MKTAYKSANKNIVWGLLWFVGGIIVTIVTYAMAANGGTYVVAWGAVVFGLVDLIKGYILRRQANKALDEFLNV